MSDSLQNLADAIVAGTATTKEQMGEAMRGLFGSRFHSNSIKPLDRSPAIRNAYGESGESEHVAFAGFIHPESASSGPYGGTSLVWFPSENGSMIDFGIGTRGLSPDEGILTRPGHRRRVESLRRFLVSQGVKAWARQDPATIGVPVPSIITDDLPAWKSVFQRYSNELYCLAEVPKNNPALARKVVQAFVDLYAYERGWEPLKAAKGEFDEYISFLRSSWLVSPSQDQIASLLKSRKFVILEGPPGTGKSRMAANILAESFKDRGVITQFHPSTTYEDFVAGLSPDIANEALRFTSRAGHLMEAAKLAKSGESLLFIDEINRADLGRVLGEAIYLFEPGKDGESRYVRLPHRIDGAETFSLPSNLYVLATMNTADRSVARMDLAIRRRFAFVTLMPDRTAVERLSTPKGLTLFDQLCSVFLEFAQDDALVLMPGHSYFITDNDETLNSRLRHELIPLIDEYLREGYLGPASASLYAVRLQLADAAGLSS
jgi:5-methylcytosine-specific restriction protein B